MNLPIYTVRRAAVFSLLAALWVTACKRETPVSQAKKEGVSEPAGPRVTPFGGPHLGFVDFLERDARFAVMHRFIEDTDGDGNIDPELGDHGEPGGDLPVVTVHDFRTGKQTLYDELIATDSRLRYVVVRKDADVVLWSASGAVKLPNADPREDANPCMPARQASIDPGGTWMTYLRAHPDRVVVRELQTGNERELPAKGNLWRADPTPRGWAMLREIINDTNQDAQLNWPRRKGSCVCRWCAKFAKSLGAAGFEAGDEFQSTLVDPTGRRIEGFEQPLPVAPGRVWSLTRHRLYDLEGNVVELGPDEACRLAALPLETGKLVTRCGARFQIWDPVSGESVPIKQRIEALELYAPALDGWLGVRVDGEAGIKHIGRLNLETGVVEVGPTALRVGPAHPSGWVLVADAGGTHAFNIATGATTSIDGVGDHYIALGYRADDAWVVVDPEQGKTARVDKPPLFVAANGCFVKPYDTSQPVKGPFELVCMR